MYKLSVFLICVTAVGIGSCSGSRFRDPYAGMGAASISSDTLYRHAPQALPREIDHNVRVLMDIRSVQDADVSSRNDAVLSPGGGRLFYSWTVTGTSQIWRLDNPLGTPTQMTSGGEFTRMVSITPDSKYLVVSRDYMGTGDTGLYLQEAGGGELVAIQQTPGVRTLFQFVSDDSRYVYFTANDVNPNTYTVYRFDLQNRTKQLVFGQEGQWTITDYHTDGKLLIQKDMGPGWNEYYEWDPNEEKLQYIIGQGEKSEYLLRFGAHAGEYIALTAKLSEMRKLYSLKAGKLWPIGNPHKSDITTFTIDRFRKRIYYELNDNGHRRLRVLDAATFSGINIPSFDASNVYLESVSRDGGRMVIGTTTPRGAAQIYVYQWSNHHLQPWLLPTAPETDTSRFTEATAESYAATDGTEIPMWVRRPKKCAADPCPVIVFFHDGPAGQAKPTWRAEAQAFLDAGFIYVEPNIRGSDGYGKTWRSMDDAAGRVKTITDIEDCAKHIRKSWAQDGKAPKIGITGIGHGGYLALMGMTRFAGAYDAGAAVSGIPDLIPYLKNSSPFARLSRIAEYGDPSDDWQILRDLSPVTHIERIRGPIQMIHGVNDFSVPVTQINELYEYLVRHTSGSEMILFRNEGRSFHLKESWIQSVGHRVRFFRKKMLGLD
jgi:dipeptidyl aminopeptidase/acylaminoacyl peptidase